ncbi:hypothetical protein FFRU_012150 [Fructobacillus fructosus]|uniref:helix-turn-helix domain-containing protein n=1 Tax=Fructobacillus fructosus TaxID=1631 RepID=UPI000219552B|nr:helix-turn-helix transcriptional regulator [Fructobacillus fructosus]GAP00806.1 hypothetical protein FFRU_012150 [Fructobacillus fructosus]
MQVKVTVKEPEELKRHIYQGGESISGFSRRIGVSVPYMSNVVSGKMNPSPTTAKKIADGLGVKLTSIFLV